MGHTRVNLKHLLEDIRDAYPFPVHEAVVTELVANALDSGASEIRFSVSFDPPRLVCADNGGGMSRKDLERYHDIAATKKRRGQGIGFAGVGAKLSLLGCREVVTETRNGDFEGATSWWLESPTTAPWEDVEARGLLPFSTGTAVCLYLDGLDSELLDEELLEQTLRQHYEPLLDPDVKRFLFVYYPEGVTLSVNGTKVESGQWIPDEARAVGDVGARNGRPIGAVALGVAQQPLPREQQGLAISVLGKVVKRGWEWLGISPEHPEIVTGVVEVPQLVRLLTLNKSDFLRDAASIQRFYSVRKRIQDSVSLLLRDLGELSGRRRKARDLRPAEREVARVLDRVLADFPELKPLLNRRRGWERVAGMVTEPQEEPRNGRYVQGVNAQPALPGLELSPPDGTGETAEGESSADRVVRPATGARRKKKGLRLAWVDDPARRDELAWLEGSLLALNRSHPACGRVRGAAAERVLVVTGIALALGRELDEGRDPVGFISEFLAQWGGRRGDARERPAEAEGRSSGSRGLKGATEQTGDE